MLRIFKEFEYNGEGSYSNSLATLKVTNCKKEHNKVKDLVKVLTNKDPDIELKFTKNNLYGLIWYKKV